VPARQKAAHPQQVEIEEFDRQAPARQKAAHPQQVEIEDFDRYAKPRACMSTTFRSGSPAT
jgi:hypothetical protein